MPRCAKCGSEVSTDDLYHVNGKDLCEDCAMSSQGGPKPCDVWAVRIATNTRKQMGMKGVEGLTARQRAIYELLESRNGVTLEELKQEMNLEEAELRKELAVLRHCELSKAYKKDNEVYYVPWNFDDSK